MSFQASNNSYSTSTSVRFGAKELPDTWWNVMSFEMPTISLDTPKFNSRPGATSAIAADTCTYTDFGVELILDKDWKIYDELYQYFLEGLNVENAKFSHQKKFELWIAFYDGKGKEVKKFWIHSARLLEFGGILATPNDAEDTQQTLALSFSILYFQPDK